MSPRVLVDLLEVTGPWVEELFRSIDPHAPAHWAVAWAGEETSAHWFDVGRDYTERWLHQQQIRDAVGAPPLTGRRVAPPGARALRAGASRAPIATRSRRTAPPCSWPSKARPAATGRSAAKRGAWQLLAGAGIRRPTPRSTLSDDTAWRLFSKGLGPRPRAARVRIDGDQALGDGACSARSPSWPEATAEPQSATSRGDRRPPCRPPRPEGPPPPPAARPSRTRSAPAPAPRARAVPREARWSAPPAPRRAPRPAASRRPASPPAIRPSSPIHAMPTATPRQPPAQRRVPHPGHHERHRERPPVLEPRRAPPGWRPARSGMRPTGATRAPGSLAVQRPEPGDGPRGDQQRPAPAAAPPPGSGAPAAARARPTLPDPRSSP